ncbi:MAG: hypothetical protein ABFD89_00695 [Bryobacteraceae bacterium]
MTTLPCLVFLALLIVALFSGIALHDASRERHERNKQLLLDACRRAEEEETVNR